MSYKDLPYIERVGYPYQRKSLQPLKGSRVLSTGFDVWDRTQVFRRNLKKVEANHPKRWFMQFLKFGSDPRELTLHVPRVMHAINNSRRLRRMHISGIRACNVLPPMNARTGWRYLSDFIFDSFDGACIVASGLVPLIGNHKIFVHFKPQRARQGSRKRQLEYWHDEFIDMLLRKSHLSPSVFEIRDNIPEKPDQFDTLIWEVSSPRLDSMQLIRVIFQALDEYIWHFELLGNGNKIRLSKDSTFDEDDYMVRESDRVGDLDFRFKRFSQFGIYHHNPEYQIY